ncbi:MULTISPECIES: hypothetical protein [Streptomyces]|uniref:hypothetical protein n=1 Tax=Streptomyces TaxID=1883 RepID=UPI00211A03CC|nr:hypothetical protein [Streptomyces hilarionis]MCQ9129648.1 hypothetical protein [Streptomyces hilarionis]
MTEHLPADVAAALETVLDTERPAHLALRRQLGRLRVVSRCSCGCGTAFFDVRTDDVEPAPTGPGTVVAAEAQFVTAAGECPGEVLVFVQGGYLSWLEVCSWSDDVEVSLTAPGLSLRPC